jgi:hypothetical protein
MILPNNPYLTWTSALPSTAVALFTYLKDRTRSMSRHAMYDGATVLGDITGPPCNGGHKYKDLVLQNKGWTQGWQTSSVKKLLFRNPKKWNPDTIWQNLLRKAVSHKGMFCQWWWWWWWWWWITSTFSLTPYTAMLFNSRLLRCFPFVLTHVTWGSDCGHDGHNLPWFYRIYLHQQEDRVFI